MEDEVILSGKYKSFNVGVRFGLDGVDEEVVANTLEFLRTKIDPIAYEFEEINLKTISDFAKIDGKGVNSIIDFLSSNSPGSIKKLLLSSTKNPKLYDVAESYFLNVLFNSANVRYNVELPKLNLKPEKEEIPNQIAFIGHYGKWMAIKKLSLKSVDEDWEVCAILSGIHQTLLNKTFDFLNLSVDSSTIKKLGGGKRKSFGNLLNALKLYEKELTGDKNKDALTLKLLLESIKYRPYPNLQMLLSAHPDVKIPKPRGRAPKS